MKMSGPLKAPPSWVWLFALTVVMCAFAAGQPASLAQRAPEAKPATALPASPLPARSPQPVPVQTAKPLPAPKSSQTMAPLAPPDPGVTDKYCVACHNDRLKTAGLSLQGLALTDVPEHAEIWEKVMRKVRSGEMPPATVRNRPDAGTASALVSFLETSLDRDASAHPNPGRAPVHRLNRAEYSNAIRDLLAVDVRPGEWLPVDDSGYGFDNIAAVLSTSPALLERYMMAARRVSRFAVGDLTLKPADEIYDAKRDPIKGSRNEQLNDELPFDSRAGMTVAHYFPLDAEYVFKIRIAGAPVDVEELEDAPYDVRVAVPAGLHTVGVTSPRENLKAENDAPA